MGPRLLHVPSKLELTNAFGLETQDRVYGYLDIEGIEGAVAIGVLESLDVESERCVDGKLNVAAVQPLVAVEVSGHVRLLGWNGGKTTLRLRNQPSGAGLSRTPVSWTGGRPKGERRDVAQTGIEEYTHSAAATADLVAAAIRRQEAGSMHAGRLDINGSPGTASGLPSGTRGACGMHCSMEERFVGAHSDPSTAVTAGIARATAGTA